MRSVLIKFRIAALAVFLWGCYNPFFPPTGIPSQGVGDRTTPKKVIDQLIASYERKQIYLFNDLLSENFRFYVTPTLVAESHRGIIRPETIDDTAYFYILAGTYYYWTADEEKKAHQGLFDAAERIAFTTPPQYGDVNSYYYTISVRAETLGTVLDTVTETWVYDVKNTYDTSSVEIRMLSGEIQIDLSSGRYVVEIGEQVFYLERDGRDSTLWVISKWFDLGTASSG